MSDDSEDVVTSVKELEEIAGNNYARGYMLAAARIQHAIDHSISLSDSDKRFIRGIIIDVKKDINL